MATSPVSTSSFSRESPPTQSPISPTNSDNNNVSPNPDQSMPIISNYQHTYSTNNIPFIPLSVNTTNNIHNNINNGNEVNPSSLPNVLIIGAGEYTTGFVHNSASNSDKSAGVIAIVIFDLRARNKIGSHIGLCARNGTQFPAIRKHLFSCIQSVYGLSTECTTYPDDNVSNDPNAYKTAVTNHFKPGDIAIIATPDSSHYDMALFCIQHKMHVLLVKPLVQTLKQHKLLIAAANKHNVLLVGEFHKRYDPLYNDAINKIHSRKLGNFNYFYSYMSQPKSQLYTFANWFIKPNTSESGNKSSKRATSDISYYLNSHHIDILCYALSDIAKPVKVSAVASYGLANQLITELKSNQTNNNNNNSNTTTNTIKIEDTITLTVTFHSITDPNTIGTAVFTASWTANKGEVHSQQRFFFLGSEGEINIDQAHRGYTYNTDTNSLKSLNPLFMRYEPDSFNSNRFVGQNTYGYKSFEIFIDAVKQIKSASNLGLSINNVYLSYLHSLPVIQSSITQQTTAILSGGRLSLDNNGISYEIVYEDAKSQIPIEVKPILKPNP